MQKSFVFPKQDFRIEAFSYKNARNSRKKRRGALSGTNLHTTCLGALAGACRETVAIVLAAVLVVFDDDFVFTDNNRLSIRIYSALAVLVPKMNKIDR